MSCHSVSWHVIRGAPEAGAAAALRSRPCCSWRRPRARRGAPPRPQPRMLIIITTISSIISSIIIISSSSSDIIIIIIIIIIIMIMLNYAELCHSLSHSPALQTSPCVRRAIVNERKNGVATKRAKGNANREAPSALEANIMRQGGQGASRLHYTTGGLRREAGRLELREAAAHPPVGDPSAVFVTAGLRCLCCFMRCICCFLAGRGARS